MSTRAGLSAGALVALVALATGCLPSTGAPAPPSSFTAGEAAPGERRVNTAAAALQSLEVKGRAPRTGYDRELFGPAWADVDRNGCRTREDVLRRDLADVVLEPGTDGCVVTAGVLDDPYTGDRIDFVRGQETSAVVQIDHVVAVSDAWQKGAQQWDPATREAFANDPLNLLAVDGPTNAAKGDGDAATWLPPQRSFRCAYVARQVAVKSAYALWVTSAERDAIARVLQNCADQPLPAGAHVAVPAPGAVAPGRAAAASTRRGVTGGHQSAEQGTVRRLVPGGATYRAEQDASGVRPDQRAPGTGGRPVAVEPAAVELPAGTRWTQALPADELEEMDS